MSIHRISLTPAFVLHTRPYRNTSLIVELFTKEFGRVAAIANSARGPRSRYRGTLQPFFPLLVSWSGKRELKTLGEIELTSSLNLLEGDALLCGFYMNELMLRLLHHDDAHPVLFDQYADTLNELTHTQNISKTLRQFEKILLQRLGYGLPLKQDAQTGLEIESHCYYRYLPDRGFVRCDDAQEGPFIFSGQSLVDLKEDHFDDEQTQKDAKRLFRIVLARHLGDKPLMSRQLF